MPENKEDLQQLLDIVEEESRKKGLELNSKSTEVMVVSGSNERPQTNIFINVNKLKQRNKFKFNIKWWTQLHWNCIKNSSSKKEFPENKINTNKKPHLDSHKNKSPVVLCWTHSDVWMRGLDNFKTVKKKKLEAREMCSTNLKKLQRNQPKQCYEKSTQQDQSWIEYINTRQPFLAMWWGDRN